LPFEFGPPASLKPPHELLGEVYLELGQEEAALDAFRRALDLTPERTVSLRGVVFAAEALQDTSTAQDARARLDSITGQSK
jgi:cytochrome c-type biogenesis protein CcmH/NrfG